MNDLQIKTLLMQAVSSPLGIKITCTDADQLRRRFYAARRGQSDFTDLMFRISPSDSNELWVIKGKPNGE